MTAASILLVALAVGQSDGGEAPNLAGQVKRLVGQLDDDDLSQRDAARSGLIELGPEILEFLPQPDGRTPAEVKIRLDQIRGALERAASVAVIEPTRVTLRGEMKLSTALAALEAQTSNKVVDYRDRFGGEVTDPTITVDLNNVVYWKALDTVLDQASMAVYSFGGEQNAAVIVSRDEGQLSALGRAVYGGIFRVEATQLRATRDLRNPQNQSLQLTLEITWEPRVMPIAVQQPLSSIVAEDEAGNPLSIPGQEGTLDAPVHAGLSAVNLHVPIELPGRQVHKIASLRGEMNALLPGRVETFVFEEIEDARNVERTNAGATILFRELRKNGEIYEANLLVRFEQTSDAMESHYGWVVNNEAYMLTGDEQKIEHAGYETWRRDVNAIGVAYKFVLNEEPKNLRFVYVTPTGMLRTPISFELRDIELP